MKKLAKIIFILLGILYAPVYFASWLLKTMAFIIIAIANLGMLRPHMFKFYFRAAFGIYTYE